MLYVPLDPTIFGNLNLGLAWQIASDGPVLEPRPLQVERQRWCLFRCRRPPANEDIWGKKWVTLTDHAGTR